MGSEPGWVFSGGSGVFSMKEPQRTSYLYFPLVNEAGMMSAVTPNGHGSATSGHYTFLLPPVSVEDLHQSKASRNFWVHTEQHGAWSAMGNSANQQARRLETDSESEELEAGFLWHRTTRRNLQSGLQAEVTQFVPGTSDKVELMQVRITNTANESLTITPTAAVPLYGRGADEQRDHRHVTSLLHRVYVSTYGIELQPALSFDERGHRVNTVTYSVLGADGNGTAPIGFFPITEDFVGEGGSLDWPEAIVRNDGPHAASGAYIEGYEAIGALRFAPCKLMPGQSKSYTIALLISDDRPALEAVAAQYLAEGQFHQLLEENKRQWEEKLGTVQFRTGDSSFDQWMKWVTLQPILRRLMGNSFLPYHDYGRGGRGWRDLWQDCLALLFMEPEKVRELLYNNFAGVRIDGSNATIIGSQPGEFIADRNNIPRVWMDHGAWPFLTTLLYIHQSGDLRFLLEEQAYFKDSHIARCRAHDQAWSPEMGSLLLNQEGEAYRGTILEHLLLQNIVPFYLVGEHNIIRLEGADWNDGLDMAAKRGESAAFTAFYAYNLLELAGLLRGLKSRLQLQHIEIAEEILILFDTLTDAINYDSIEAKHQRAELFFASCPHTVKGRKVQLEIDAVIDDLVKKADWISVHLLKQEWITNREGHCWFNGYYNNDGLRVEGDHPNGVRMTLTGQVFTLMGGVARDEQVQDVIAAVERYLHDPKIGYRLNSNFGEIQQNLGRAFGFAFGHKENGAMFSHMTVMYAYALYRRGYAKTGHEVLQSIYSLSTDFKRSRMYPGIPEYINERGRGMYPYLTGSASWFLLTQVTEVFGIKGYYGDLLLEPKLMPEQFDQDGLAGVITSFAGQKLQLIYRNASHTPFGSYEIKSVQVNGQTLPFTATPFGVCIKRSVIEALGGAGDTPVVEVELQVKQKHHS